MVKVGGGVARETMHTHAHVHNIISLYALYLGPLGPKTS